MSHEEDTKTRIKMTLRFQTLATGESEPETLEDDMFLLFYEAGVMGVNLMDIYLTICDDSAIMSLELHAAFIGYSLGQSVGQSITGDDPTKQPH